MSNDHQTLNELIERMETGPEGTLGHISANWMQGRTAFGGITAALALAAIRRDLPDLPQLRSVQMTYLRPIGADIVVRVELVRAGRTASFVRVEVHSEGAMGAQGMFVFGAARDSAQVHDYVTAPALPGPEDCPEFARRGASPSFIWNFEVKQADGDPLISGSDRPEMSVWGRLKETEGVSSEIALVCLADVLPPAAMTGFTQPAPISTITWQVDLARIPPQPDWVCIRTTSQQAAEGYSLQDMDLRDRDGRLLGSAKQLVALFA